MTYEDRERIFSKEIITYLELAELLQVDPSTASTILNSIKKKSDRLHIRGKIHVQDYLDYFGIKSLERYKKVDDIGDFFNLT